MSKRAPLTDQSGEVRELTKKDLRHFKPAAEVLPPDLLRTMGIKARGPAKGTHQAGHDHTPVARNDGGLQGDGGRLANAHRCGTEGLVAHTFTGVRDYTLPPYITSLVRK